MKRPVQHCEVRTGMQYSTAPFLSTWECWLINILLEEKRADGEKKCNLRPFFHFPRFYVCWKGLAWKHSSLSLFIASKNLPSGALPHTRRQNSVTREPLCWNGTKTGKKWPFPFVFQPRIFCTLYPAQCSILWYQVAKWYHRIPINQIL